MLRITLCLAVIGILATPAAAQTGRVAGALTDETGGVLPGVEVRALMRDDSGETTRSVVTNGSGRYELNALAPGAWVITASLPGFETATRRQTVQAGDSLDWSPMLELGMIQETLAITTADNSPVRSEAQRRPAAAPAAGATAAASAAGPTPVRVGGNVKPPMKVVNVRPVYPADAAAQGVSGVVIMRATIAIDGTVRDIQPLRSPNESLTQAATNALLGWEFSPTLLNGTPVATRMMATFNFTKE